MKYRTLGRTGFNISEISLGTWQVGGKWGEPFSHQNADKILKAAVDNGINFIDTADVYGDGESEKAVGRLLRSHSGKILVATKCGRRLQPHNNKAYNPRVLRQFVEDSLKNIGVDTIDLIQLHCPPTEVYYRPEIFAEFDKLIKEGKIRKLGVSVEKVEEALKAIEYPNVDTVQIIFNIFRQRPKELFFEQARKKNIGVIIRVPLASGLLSGKFDIHTKFSPGDHRNFNRDGAAFDKGETFAGIDYNKGLEAVEELKKAFPDTNLAALALRWILMFEEVSCIIPGASKVDQILSNVRATSMDILKKEEMDIIEAIYSSRIKNEVHHLW
ncbi:MAG: aldo/keto reductase [Bacteroidales bacterium]|nr:aldo/keto reductase [Bacteroidales bacterium]MBN2764121.1 aldo/keto reductase [Bacteroidales bacterium]